MPDRQPKILVIRRRYLGDLVLISPLFRNLRAHWPNCWITLACDERYTDIYTGDPDVDEVLAIPEGRGGQFGQWLRVLATVRKRRFTVLYDLTRNNRTAMVVKASGAARRVTFDREGETTKRTKLFNILAPWSEANHHSLHIVDLYLKLIEADGVPIVTREVALPVSAEESAWADEFVRGQWPDRQLPLLVVHPGARASTKCWPAENFAAVCDAVQSAGQAHVLLLAGPGEGEALAAIRDSMHTPAVALESALTVHRLAALLATADLFLGNNSGPMHVAAAVGTPAVALFGAHPANLWRPWGEHHTVLQPPLPCAPCPFADICAPPDADATLCVRRLTVDQVISAMRDQLTRITVEKIGAMEAKV